jgi:lysozyme family protein
MADFSIAYKLTMAIEIGWVNDPRDHGGETINGISRRSFPEWAGWPIVDQAKKEIGFPANLKIKDELNKLIRAFYKQQFWNKLSLDAFAEQKIANELFDTGVNCGSGVAATFLQRALNVCNRNQRDYPNIIVDGIIGGKTIGVINSHRRPLLVLKTLNVLQGARYFEICEHKEDQEIFWNSWMSRVFENI